MKHYVFIVEEAPTNLGPYTPDRVIANDWGLTLIWDYEEGVEKTNFPWHRIKSWHERSPSKPPLSKDPT